MVCRGIVCCTTNSVFKMSSKCNYQLHIMYLMVMIIMLSVHLQSTVTVAVWTAVYSSYSCMGYNPRQGYLNTGI